MAKAARKYNIQAERDGEMCNSWQNKITSLDIGSGSKYGRKIFFKAGGHPYLIVPRKYDANYG